MRYVSLMVDSSCVRVLKVNARFGSPEAQSILPLLDGDPARALAACAAGDMHEAEETIGHHDGAAVAVVVASEGYPDEPLTGRSLAGADPSGPADDGRQICFHGATRRARDGVVSSGGRVVTYVGRGSDIADAREAAYGAVEGCRLEGGHFRTDIGLREVATA